MQEELEQLKQQFYQHQHTNADQTLPLPQNVFITVNLPDATAQTATNYGMCFTATRPCFVKAISEKHAIAGTVGTPTLQVERLQGTTALGSGINLLSIAFALSGTAYTTQRGSLANLKTISALNLNDSLALKVSGTLTTLKGVQVTIEIQFI